MDAVGLQSVEEWGLQDFALRAIELLTEARDQLCIDEPASFLPLIPAVRFVRQYTESRRLNTLFELSANLEQVMETTRIRDQTFCQGEVDILIRCITGLIRLVHDLETARFSDAASEMDALRLIRTLRRC
jgi:hypothetical protein